MAGVVSPGLLLSGGSVALSGAESRRLDVAVSHGRLSFTSGAQPVPQIRLDGCLILPGLINAHDHLEFSLFPRLSRGPFSNARAWAQQVYRPAENPVLQQLHVAKDERLIWGGLRNLLCGVTSVCHHNPYFVEVFDDCFQVTISKNYGWAHSIDFCDDIAERFSATSPGAPFIIHLAEGTDEQARGEIFALDAIGALAENTVLVHGVGIDDSGLDLVESRGASLIWCPSSNLFTLGATLRKALFHRDIPIALATDSALTAEGDLLDELAVARELDLVDRSRLYEMVTTEAARILRLDQAEGRLAEGGVADLVVVGDRGLQPFETLTGDTPCEPLLVMVRGEIKLVAEEFAGRVPPSETVRLRRIHLEGRAPCLVAADVPSLLAAAHRALGDEPVRVGGKAVLE